MQPVENTSPQVTLPFVSATVLATAAVNPALQLDRSRLTDGLAPLLPVHRAAMTLDPGCPPILVADDDEDDRFFVTRLIKKSGVKNPVKAFDDGSEVVNFLGSVRGPRATERRRPPLLLFLDLKMRGLGGFGFLEWARKQPELAPLTIVVLTNSENPEDMSRALELGAHRYLVKYPSAQTFATIVRGVYPLTVF